MPAAYNTTERYRELENRLSECRGRINILEEKLLESPVSLSVAEFDRLLDEYRAEQYASFIWNRSRTETAPRSRRQPPRNAGASRTGTEERNYIINPIKHLLWQEQRKQ